MRYAILMLALAGCGVAPTFPIDEQRVTYTTEPWRECDQLFGTFGKFLDAAGCYKPVHESGRWVCHMVVGLKPNNLARQQKTEAHETRHCNEGDFHKGELQDRVLLLF
jgi:hypothetical protein